MNLEDKYIWKIKWYKPNPIVGFIFCVFSIALMLILYTLLFAIAISFIDEKYAKHTFEKHWRCPYCGEKLPYEHVWRIGWRISIIIECPYCNHTFLDKEDA